MIETDGPSFEDAMKRLTDIVTRLDGGNVGLDESVQLFREGQSLAKRCEDLLRAAQEEIRLSQYPAHLSSAGAADDEGEEGFDGELPF
jgi:exodeoxyribonuclease VII small subunit